MQKRFRVNVDGRDFDVVVEEISTDGGVVAAPVFASAPVAAAPIAPPPPPVNTGASAVAGAQTAPLSGVVESLPVAVGAAVAVGDVVAVIEAMKMKTEVISRVAGSVRSIAVAVGQPVEAGEVLLVVA